MAAAKPIIGVLALQGAVDLHKPHIIAAGGAFRAVKTVEQFEAVDAFILPGGESTTMLRLIDMFDLWDVLADQFTRKPVWGICAGTILIAETVYRTSRQCHPDRAQRAEGSPGAMAGDPSTTGLRPSAQDDTIQKSFGMLPITVERNGYGRQLDSHDVEIDGYPVSFIRAPIIEDAGDCEILASHNDKPAWVRKGHIMASAFHPEINLDAPSPMHEFFIKQLVRP